MHQPLASAPRPRHHRGEQQVTCAAFSSEHVATTGNAVSPCDHTGSNGHPLVVRVWFCPPICERWIATEGRQALTCRPLGADAPPLSRPALSRSGPVRSGPTTVWWREPLVMLAGVVRIVRIARGLPVQILDFLLQRDHLQFTAHDQPLEPLELLQPRLRP
jgi:hypothetical protein